LGSSGSPGAGGAGRRDALPGGRRAAGLEAGHGTEAELHLLCTHGVLHLLGYDHGEDEERAQMFGL
jgi:probable rRNA maturation factor